MDGQLIGMAAVLLMFGVMPVTAGIVLLKIKARKMDALVKLVELGANVDAEMAVDAGAAQCRRTDAEADLRLDIDALGALYLGAHRASTLALARRVSGSEQVLATANQLFAWDPPPWCPELF